ncbi:MAG TPA: hypothetical protein VK975_02555 [Acidimicrobiales bacterium]|nr:hypothetical protein [Acidimicrobiales bacterium]
MEGSELEAIDAGHPVLAAFVERGPAADDGQVAIEGDALMVDGWWPAALWLGPTTCLTRADGCPRPGLPEALAAGLASIGVHEVEVDLAAAVEAISVGRLGLLGGEWQVRSTSDDAARSAVTAAASG